MTNKTEAMDTLPDEEWADMIDRVMAYLNEPYDPVQVIKDLLEHAVFDEALSDECIDAVENARGYLEQEASQPTQSDALKAENERLREHLISALDTLKDAEVCDDNCGPCNEARAALQEQSK